MSYERRITMVRCGYYTCKVLSLLLWTTLANSEGHFDHIRSTTPNSSHQWHYDYIPGSPYGPDHWGTINSAWHLCTDGQRQSPIALTSRVSTIDESLGNLNFTYVPSKGVLSNKGHAVQVDFESGAGRLVIESEVYNLKQLHFHSPSEHAIEHSKFALEMHLVHTSTDGKRLAAIGIVFFKGGHNHFLSQFWDQLPGIMKKGVEVQVNGTITFERLDFGPTYARYNGSLTTPPCSENVIWTVPLSKRNTISQCQLDKLKEVLKEPNARPLQKLNGRQVVLSGIRSPVDSSELIELAL